MAAADGLDIELRTPAFRHTVRVLIRPATPADAAGIAAVHVASWQAAYRGVLPDEVLDGLDVERRRAGWQAVLQRSGAGEAAFLAEDRAGVVAGFVHAVRSRDDDSDEATGEVTSLYVDPPRWGTGAGRELMAAALAALRSAGFATVTLWVLEGNARGRRFYDLGGFAPDGVTKDDVLAGAAIREVRYRRRL